MAMGYWIDKNFLGQGLATVTVALTDLAFITWTFTGSRSGTTWPSTAGG